MTFNSAIFLNTDVVFLIDVCVVIVVIVVVILIVFVVVFVVFVVVVSRNDNFSEKFYVQIGLPCHVLGNETYYLRYIFLELK